MLISVLPPPCTHRNPLMEVLKIFITNAHSGIEPTVPGFLYIKARGRWRLYHACMTRESHIFSIPSAKDSLEGDNRYFFHSVRWRARITCRYFGRQRPTTALYPRCFRKPRRINTSPTGPFKGSPLPVCPHSSHRDSPTPPSSGLITYAN